MFGSRKRGLYRGRGGWRIGCWVAALALGGLMAATARAQGGPTIATDKGDYSPGSLVQVSGSGWQPGESIHLVLDESPATHPRLERDVVADGEGWLLVPDLYLVEDHDGGVLFVLTATGAVSGSAVTTFWDGAINMNPLTVAGSTVSGTTLALTTSITTTGNPAETMGSVCVAVVASDASNVVTPISPGPTGGCVINGAPGRLLGTLPTGQTVLLNWTASPTLLAGASSGSVTFSAFVTWSGMSGQPRTTTPALVQVLPATVAAQLAIPAVTPSTASVVAGTAFTVDVTVRNVPANANPASIAAVSLSESTGLPSPSCGSASLVSGAATIVAGQQSVYRFTCQTAPAGTFKMRATASGSDTVTGAPLSAGPVQSPTITVLSPAAGLAVDSVAATPTSATDGQAIAVDVVVKNTAVAGGHAASGLAVQVAAGAATSGNASATGCTQTSAPNPAPLAPQATRQLSFSCTATGAGSFPFQANVTASDGGTPLSAVGQSPTVTVIDPISPTVTISPSPIPWSSADLVFEISATDNDQGSGVKNVTVQIDGADPQVTSGSSVSVSLTTEASHTIAFFATDHAGNNSLTTAVAPGIDRTLPTIQASQAPAANSAGWNRSAVTVAFSCADGLSGVKSCTAPVTLTGETAGTEVTGTAVDNAGNTRSLDHGPVRIDLTPPAISGAPQAAPNAAGWYNQPVSVQFNCSDALSGLATVCPFTALVGSEGTDQGTSGTAEDRAGNQASATVGGLNIDLGAPVITGSRNPDPNAAGWNNGDVTVSFACSDALSGVAAGSCPAPSVVSSEGEGQSVSGNVSDNAGNSSSATVGSINIDRTAPLIDLHISPAPNAAGWNRSDVTASFTCTDALSGLEAAACPAPQSYSSDGLYTASGSVSDRAGNLAQRSAPVKLDATNPVIVGARAPLPNLDGWSNSPVTVSFECTDALSGVASCSPASQTLLGEGAGQSVAGSAVDRADNSAGAQVGGINIDLTPPIVALTRTPPPNAAGWNNQGVAVHVECVDALSGVDTCPLDRLFDGDGLFSAGGIASDRAGNTAAASPIAIQIDKTPPVVVGPASPVVVEALGGSGAPATFAVSASDALSGVVTGSLLCTAGGLPVSSGDLFPLGATTVLCAAMDLAGNSGGTSFTVLVRDTTAPAVGPAANLSAFATSTAGAPVSYTAPSASDLVDGSVPVTCSPASGSTFAPGSTTVSCSATDSHGNTGTRTFVVKVVFQTAPAGSFFLQPINGDGSSVFKQGSTVPVKFQLQGVSASISNLVAHISLAKLTDNVEGSYLEATSTAAADSGNTFRYDSTGALYIFNLSTKPLTVGTYRLKADLHDGSSHLVDISIRK